MQHTVTKLSKVLKVVGQRNIFLLAISLLIALASVVFNDSWLIAAREDNKVLSSLNRSTQEIAKLEVNLLKAESAQRGYLLTNSKDYLRPYDEAVAGVRRSVENIRKVFSAAEDVKEYEQENKLLLKISNSTASKISGMDLTLQFAREGELQDAKKVVELDSGLIEMGKFSSYSAALIDLLDKRILKTYNDRNVKRAIARVSTILSPLILLILVMLIVKQLINELATKAELQEQLASEVHKHKEKSLEKSKLLQSLAFDYQSDVEREKYKLAREIHDELGSILTATKMDISWVVKSLKTTQPEIVEKLKKTNKYIDQGINFKRQIVQDLHPSMIESFGFWPALKTLINDSAERGKWQLNVNLPDESLVLNETIALVTYRIMQETLNNAIKYAEADQLSIYIINDEKNLKIEIQDNGVGMDLDELKNETHGLSGMRHRVLALGGHMELTSTIGNGLMTLAILPLNVKAPS